jgi:hypothetical protein
MVELPLDDAPSDVTAAAEGAGSGHIIYLTKGGCHLAAIVPVEIAGALELMGREAFLELVEDFADVEAARDALADAWDATPWEGVKAEAGGLVG